MTDDDSYLDLDYGVENDWAEEPLSRQHRQSRKRSCESRREIERRKELRELKRQLQVSDLDDLNWY